MSVCWLDRIEIVNMSYKTGDLYLVEAADAGSIGERLCRLSDTDRHGCLQGFGDP